MFDNHCIKYLISMGLSRDMGAVRFLLLVPGIEYLQNLIYHIVRATP